jgi:hypothetical protein
MALTHNYYAIAKRTAKPIGKCKTVARNKRWDWKAENSAPSKCIVLKSK